MDTKNIPVYSVTLPENTIDKKPDYQFLGKTIDNALKKYFLNKSIAIRCISMSDHTEKSVDDLINIIQTTGTDRYDPQRKMSVAHDFYTEKGVEIFATPVTVTHTMILMNEVIKDFYEGALQDRGYSLKIDLIIIYDISQLQIIPIQYEDGIGEESFKFKHSDKKNEAVMGIITLS